MKSYKLFIIIFVILVSVISGCNNDGEIATEPSTSTQQPQIVNVSAVEAYDLIQANLDNPDFIIIDIRTPEEYDTGHIENALLINYYATDFNERISQLDREKTYLIYCHSGLRSSLTLDIMKELGFFSIYHMNKGIKAWLAEGLPVVD